MQSIRTLHVLLIAVWSLTSNAAPFPGGGDALVNEARVWVSQETGYPSAAIEMSAPDRRVPVESCETPLEFRFPFQGNQRTVEAVCKRPTWKRFIRVKIDEKNRAVATTQALTAGHTLAISDLRLIPYSGLTAEIHDDPQRLIGLTLRDSLDANTVIKRQMVIQEMAVFVTDRAYEAGELIERANLKRMETETPPANSLSAWPSGVIIASRYIEPGQTLLDSDIEQSEYVVISSTNIIRGQVITQAMVERTLQPKKQIGAQTLSTLEEAIGLEATRTIRTGTPITISDLTAADLVRKGENVTLTVTKGILRISVDTIALENGKMGEQVELTNAESGKVIRGIVTGRHQAKGISP